MVISVLERRQEIGLRPALGATRGQIRACYPARCPQVHREAHLQACPAARTTLPAY
jgi:hypothetical protein